MVWQIEDKFYSFGASNPSRAEVFLGSCCQNKYTVRKEHVLEEMGKEQEPEPEEFGSGLLAPYQRRLWDLFEKPESSSAASLVSNISILLVFVSTAGMVLASMPELEAHFPKLAFVEDTDD